MRQWLARVWAWSRRQLRGWRGWAFLVFVGVSIPIFTYGAVRSYNYMNNDPTFCRSCHTMERAWDRWATSEHRNVTCHSCHEVNPIQGTMLIFKYVSQRPGEVGTHAGISDEACNRCHESGNKAWPQIAATAGHQVHFEEERIPCTKCHSISLHRFEPPAKVCVLCHDEEEKLTKMAQRYCLDCHQYLREGSPLRPTRSTCLDCHQKQAQTRVHWPENAPMLFQCQQCHQPHEQKEPEVNCLACHSQIRSTGLHQAQPHQATACTTCHQPHEWKVEARDTCLSCHQDRKTHNQGTLCFDCHRWQGKPQ